MKRGVCRSSSCNAEVYWITTPKGRPCPLDAKPQKVWVLEEDGSWQLRMGYTSHFATCPDAKRFDKKQGKSNFRIMISEEGGA